MDGFILDAYPEKDAATGGTDMVVWLRTDDGRAHALREPFEPAFYVGAKGDEAELTRLAEALPRAFSGLGDFTIHHRLAGLADTPEPVLRVSVRDQSRLTRIATLIDRMGAYGAYDLYDVDLRPSHRYFIAKGLFPFARVRAWAPGRYRLLDQPWRLDYPRPDIGVVKLSVTIDHAKGAIPLPAHKLLAARVDDVIIDGSETAILQGLADEMTRRDPDVILTDGGDRFLLPYLHNRAHLAGFEDYTLGREAGTLSSRKEGKSHFTYGKVKYQPPKVLLKGRVHLDAQSSFFYTQAGLAGLIDLARVTATPLQELARVGAGTAITGIQVAVASREGRLIPWKKNKPERVKTARTLLLADRGGYTFEPVVGVHENVVELDFASLFPSIAVRRNLSPETLDCACCAQEEAPLGEGVMADAYRRVPQIGYRTCARRTGFIPRTLGPIIERRAHFKRMRKTDPENARAYEECSDVYKWLLVTSYGYQGYRNAKFGAIECHESICAWSRDILLTTSAMARDRGFRVLHGISDSLWLAPEDADSTMDVVAEARALADEVEREIGIRFEYQGRYDWIVFLPTRTGNPELSGFTPEESDLPLIGALNRYYGCFDTVPEKNSRGNASQTRDDLGQGRLKVRGVELRQHSSSGIVRRAQEAALEVLSHARGADAYRALIPRALDAVLPVLAELQQGATPAKDLVIMNVVTRNEEDYRVVNLPRTALKQLKTAGVAVPPGDAVRYVVLDAGADAPEAATRPEELLMGGEGYDAAYYTKLIMRGLESLFLPFGWSIARLEERYHVAPQRRISAYA